MKYITFSPKETQTVISTCRYTVQYVYGQHGKLDEEGRNIYSLKWSYRVFQKQLITL